MQVRDLITGPFFLILIGFGAFLIRSYVTNTHTRKFFLPGLGLKVIGAVALGLIYFIHYGGADTAVYFNHGSKWIWESFLVDPILAMKLIFGDGTLDGDIYPFASRIFAFGDYRSYFVVRLAGFFDLFTFHSYFATAMCFSVVSFVGVWAMFTTFCHFYPSLSRYFAWGILFMPSLFFWGSGLLKDSVTFGATGLLFYGFAHLFILGSFRLRYLLAMVLGGFVLYIVKVYILQSFGPALIVWLFLRYFYNIRSMAVRIILFPIMGAMLIVSIYFIASRIGGSGEKFSLDSFATTVETSAKWLEYVGRTQGGSVYTLGDHDYSPAGMAKKFLPAVMVSLYQPFLWQVRNPVMLLSALENTILLGYTIYLFWTIGVFRVFQLARSSPLVSMSLAFVIVFAFGIGISTNNFGTLVRYKIPLIPFFITSLIIIEYKHKLLIRSKTPANA